jgi:hypothetical protein
MHSGYIPNVISYIANVWKPYRRGHIDGLRLFLLTAQRPRASYTSGIMQRLYTRDLWLENTLQNSLLSYQTRPLIGALANVFLFVLLFAFNAPIVILEPRTADTEAHKEAQQ